MLAYLTTKDAPLWFVDTHAGAGAYDLSAAFAQKKGEFRDGIGRLWDRKDLPPALADYVAQVRQLNPDSKLRHYPGSPQIALQMLRPQDRLQLFELHTTEGKVLQKHFAHAGRRVTARPTDGFAGLKAVLPPASRRGLALIDPSYEDKADYQRVIAALEDAMKRFPTGTYAVWYPQVQRQESQDLPGRLKEIARGDWLHVSLTVKAPADDGLGLHGSGMFVCNQPWKLEAELRPQMPALVKLLGQDRRATFKMQVQQS
jgi:23S rRNA (adenine2030-N6)-methyltransferase